MIPDDDSLAGYNDYLDSEEYIHYIRKREGLEKRLNDVMNISRKAFGKEGHKLQKRINAMFGCMNNHKDDAANVYHTSYRKKVINALEAEIKVIDRKIEEMREEAISHRRLSRMRGNITIKEAIRKGM